MVLPWAKILWISDEKGYGLVATQFIPRGTITFVKDDLDIVISPEQLPHVAPHLRQLVEKYSYEDFLGNRIISWDSAKYMNHDNEANTLTTGYDFEVAVRDIQPGEEITDDYRLFSTHHDPEFKTEPGVPREILPWPQELIRYWDGKVRSALTLTSHLHQPLRPFVNEMEWANILKLRDNPSSYRSVEESLPLNYKYLTKGTPSIA